MFLSHFNLNVHPFSENPPDQWILNDERFDQALARLQFFRRQGNLALIIGQTGIGKSSLLRIFKHSMPKNQARAIYIHLTHITPTGLLRMIVSQLGEAPRSGKDRLFLQIIDRVQKSEIETILMIDEAHLLSSQSLTDLRLLICADIPLKIVLSAQESITSLLNRTTHADLVQRLCVRCHLRSLSTDQTAAYISHRLRCAGASDKLFDTEALCLIHDYSGGVPRQINNIATASLINADSKNLQKITENIVNETMNEFRLP